MTSHRYTPIAKRKKLANINSHAWEHPSDRLALNALKQIPGFDGLLRRVVGTFGEQNISMTYKAQAVRVSEEQYPSIYQLLVGVCDTLDTEVPPLYVSQTPIVNAGAVGVERPFIVLHSSIIELMSEGELETVIGHEVGHIMSKHSLYRTLMHLLLNFGQSLTPLTGRAVLPITLALLEWHRKAEVSCDRAGLLATQNLDACLAAQAMLAGGIRHHTESINVGAFIAQSDDYRSESGLAAYYRFMANLGRTHPFPVIRVAELRNWVDSGEYSNILAGDYLTRDDKAPLSEDATTAVKTFSDQASQVFSDTDRYVNQALTSFITAAQERLDSRKQ